MHTIKLGQRHVRPRFSILHGVPHPQEASPTNRASHALVCLIYGKTACECKEKEHVVDLQLMNRSSDYINCKIEET
jgi:hypothetical protein